MRMFWAEQIPHVRAPGVDVTVIAGSVGGDVTALPPPPRSWASRPGSDVLIVHLDLQTGAQWRLPPATDAASVRALFVVDGDGLSVAGTDVSAGTRVDLRAGMPAELVAGEGGNRGLLLQGLPIDEPYAARGPFVMNTDAELDVAYDEYRTGQLGAWPWPTSSPTHGADPRRFLRRDDGTVEWADDRAALDEVGSR
jgi:hypothetical protein